MSERLRKACAKYLWMDGKSGSTGLPPIFPVPRYEGPVAPHMFYVRKVVVMEWIYKQPWVTLTFQVGRTSWNSFRTVSDCTLFWSPSERTRIGRRVMLDQLQNAENVTPHMDGWLRLWNLTRIKTIAIVHRKYPFQSTIFSVAIRQISTMYCKWLFFWCLLGRRHLQFWCLFSPGKTGILQNYPGKFSAKKNQRRKLWLEKCHFCVYTPWHWHSPWKGMVGILLSVWEGLFSARCYVSFREGRYFWHKFPCHDDTISLNFPITFQHLCLEMWCDLQTKNPRYPNFSGNFVQEMEEPWPQKADFKYVLYFFVYGG